MLLSLYLDFPPTTCLSFKDHMTVKIEKYVVQSLLPLTTCLSSKGYMTVELEAQVVQSLLGLFSKTTYPSFKGYTNKIKGNVAQYLLGLSSNNILLQQHTSYLRAIRLMKLRRMLFSLYLDIAPTTCLSFKGYKTNKIEV